MAKPNLNIIVNLLSMLNQLKIFHWQTKAYSEHMAFGTTYDTLNEVIDDFVEAFQGKYGRLVATKTFDISLQNYQDATSLIDGWITYLQSYTTGLDPECTDLLNIRDEMLQALHKLQYLLTLK